MLGVQSCSTTNHAPIYKQAYHDITSRYNAYFNAYEKWKATQKNIEENHKDNYKEVISVFSYTDNKETAAFASDYDDIAERSTKAIQLHPYANWSDDHFLLIGKSYYMKGDYEKASQTFRYISTKYKDGVDYIAIQKDRKKKYSDAVKKKKPKKDPNKPTYKLVKNKDGSKAMVAEDNRPKRTLLIHDPARSEAMVWLAKSLTGAKQFTEAEGVVAFAKSDNKFYQDYDTELWLSEADMYVKQKNYSSAIAPLEKALEKLKKKPRARTRPTFVLAQLNEAMGNYSAAAKAYKDVLKSRPNFDMEFYAKIKRANLGRKSGSGSAEVKSLLTKMSREGKYKEYLDQIFYELGEISYAESDKTSARKYFRKSVDASTGNQDQLAQTFLRLAEIDFEEQLYSPAKYNYDSCLQAMSKDDKRYTSIEFKTKMLARLVENLNIIQEEDSLQKIARMSDSERKRFAQKLIDERDAKAQAEKDAKNNPQNNLIDNNQNNPRNTNTSTGSTWYFYNATTRAQGFNEFVKRWGNRKYEENWRRADKSSTISNDELSEKPDGEKDSTNTDKKELVGKDGLPLSEEEKILQGVPLTADAMDKSNDRLAQAYYNLAVIYKDDLENYRKSLHTFETLNERLPKHRFLLEDYYYCYLLCKDYLNNQPKAEEYKNKILTEFSSSKIAALLRNENFLAEETERQNELNNYYASTYSDYMSDALASASEKIALSSVKFKPNPLKAKFDLLKILILAKENRLDDYVQELNKFIAKTDEPEIKKMAQDMLESLNQSGLPMVDLSKNPVQTDISQPLNNDTANIAATKNETSAKPTDKTTTEESTKSPDKSSVDAIESDKTVIKNEAPASVEKAKIDTVISNFTFNEGSPHLVLVFFKDVAINQQQITEIVGAVNRFNDKNFSGTRLSAKSVMVDANTKLVTVRQFKNKAEAANYTSQFNQEKQELMKNLEPSKYYVASISFENFSKLLTEKKADVYEQFYLWKYEQ